MSALGHKRTTPCGRRGPASEWTSKLSALFWRALWPSWPTTGTGRARSAAFARKGSADPVAAPWSRLRCARRA